MFVSSDTEVGEEFRGLKLAQDKVISLWTCNIPISPRYCSSRAAHLSLSCFPGILSCSQVARSDPALVCVYEDSLNPECHQELVIATQGKHREGMSWDGQNLEAMAGPWWDSLTLFMHVYQCVGGSQQKILGLYSLLLPCGSQD